jgi:hypothetical protein
MLCLYLEYLIFYYAKMNSYIKDLVSRMLDRTPSEKYMKFGFTQITYPISGEALEEARGISNIEFSSVLFSAIVSEQDIDIKGRLYFILTNLAVNTKNLEVTSFLVSRLLVEKDKYVLEEILSCLGKLYKPATMDLTPIIKCTESRNGFVRGRAYEALTNSEYNVEDFLVDKVKITQNNDDIANILHALIYVGTAKSTPIFKKFLKSRHHASNTAAITGITILLLRDSAPLQKISQISGYSVGAVKDFQDRIEAFTRRPLIFVMNENI